MSSTTEQVVIAEQLDEAYVSLAERAIPGLNDNDQTRFAQLIAAAELHTNFDGDSRPLMWALGHAVTRTQTLRRYFNAVPNPNDLNDPDAVRFARLQPPKTGLGKYSVGLALDIHDSALAMRVSTNPFIGDVHPTADVLQGVRANRRYWINAHANGVPTILESSDPLRHRTIATLALGSLASYVADNFQKPDKPRVPNQRKRTQG